MQPERPRQLTDAEVARVGRRVDRLADLYVLDAPTVARVCDEVLDRRGGLLGEVRLEVRRRGAAGGYPRDDHAA